MSDCKNYNQQERTGCTVVFSTGNPSSNHETLVLKNGDIDSHWYMQMMLSNCNEGKDFYGGPLSHFSGRKKFSYIGQRCLSYWAPHMGINEAGVSVSLLATPGREDKSRPGLLGGFDYNRIALDFAESALEGVKLIGETVQQCGFAELSMSYIIGDPDEVWLIEASGYHWAAKRFRDTVGAHANSYILETDWDLNSPGLEDYALSRGWIKQNEQLNFREAFSGSGYLDKVSAPHTDIFSSIVRQQRAEELLAEKTAAGPISVKDLMEISRDQLDDYELPGGEVLEFNQTPWHSTSFYRDVFNGGEWLDDMPADNFLRSPVFIRQICCDTVYEKTLGSAVFSSGKSDEPKKLMYALTGVPTFSAYIPFFADMKSIHPAFSGIEAARIFEDIDLHAFGKYQDFHPISAGVFDVFEADMLKQTEALDTQSYEAGQLTDFSNKYAERLLSEAGRVKELFWLYDLRIRQWGRAREFANRAPDIYTLVNQLYCIGLSGKELKRPLAVRREGVLLIDFEMNAEEAYTPISEASMKYNFEWKDLPETGDLFIYRNKD